MRGAQFRPVVTHFEWLTGYNSSTYRPMASSWQGLHLASTRDSKLAHEIEFSGQPVQDGAQSMKLHIIQKEATRRVCVLANAINIIGITKLLCRKKQIKQKITNNRLIKEKAGKLWNSKCNILLLRYNELLVWEILFEATLECREACNLGLIYIFSILLLFLANNNLFY